MLQQSVAACMHGYVLLHEASMAQPQGSCSTQPTWDFGLCGSNRHGGHGGGLTGGWWLVCAYVCVPCSLPSAQQQVSAVHELHRSQACHAATGVAHGSGGVSVRGGGMPGVCGPVCGHDSRWGRGPASCKCAHRLWPLSRSTTARLARQACLLQVAQHAGHLHPVAVVHVCLYMYAAHCSWACLRPGCSLPKDQMLMSSRRGRQGGVWSAWLCMLS